MHRWRLITALVGIPLMLGLLYRGGWMWFSFVILVHLVATAETSRLIRALSWQVPSPGLYGGAILMELGSYLWREQGYCLAGIATFLFFGCCFLFFYPRYRFGHLAGAFWLTAYLGLFSFLVLLRKMYGPTPLLVLLLLTWANDSVAYYVGKRWGRHRLAPSVSPHKTWEGALAGLFAATLVGIGAAYLEEGHWQMGGGLALLLGTAGQIGDLWESALKREAGIKDTGSLLPGHGGVLDRFDSLLFAAPLAYYLICSLGLRY